MIDFSKNKPYISSCKYLHINILIKNNLYIRLSRVFTLFCLVHNSGRRFIILLGDIQISFMNKIQHFIKEKTRMLGDCVSSKSILTLKKENKHRIANSVIAKKMIQTKVLEKYCNIRGIILNIQQLHKEYI